MGASTGVTGPQRLVLHIVGRFPGISAGQLASTLHVHPSTLTGVLERLVRRGLISRRPDPRDGRRAALGLTPDGRRLEPGLTGTVQAAVREVMQNVPRSRVRTAAQVLAMLAERLDDECRDTGQRIAARTAAGPSGEPGDPEG